MVISGGNFSPDILKPKEVVSLLLDDDEMERKRKCLRLSTCSVELFRQNLSYNGPCGLRGCKNGPAPFPSRMSYKVTKPGLVCLSYLSMLYYCIVVY